MIDIQQDIDNGGFMTRSKIKMIKQALQGLIVEIKKSTEQRGLDAAPKWTTLYKLMMFEDI